MLADLFLCLLWLQVHASPCSYTWETEDKAVTILAHQSKQLLVWFSGSLYINRHAFSIAALVLSAVWRSQQTRHGAQSPYLSLPLQLQLISLRVHVHVHPCMYYSKDMHMSTIYTTDNTVVTFLQQNDKWIHELCKWTWVQIWAFC